MNPERTQQQIKSLSLENERMKLDFDRLQKELMNERLERAKWKEEIIAALENAQVAILLISKEFLASEFIKNEELPPILKSAGEKGTKLLFLLINRCIFQLIPHLSQYQAMNPPDRPLSKLPEEEQDEYFVQVVEEVLKAQEALTQ